MCVCVTPLCHSTGCPFKSLLHFAFSYRISWWTLSSLFPLGWLARQTPQYWGCKRVLPRPAFYVSAEDLNSGHHPCKEGTLSTEPSPKPNLFLLSETESHVPALNLLCMSLLWTSDPLSPPPISQMLRLQGWAITPRLCYTGDQTQHLRHTRQELYQLNHIPSLQVFKPHCTGKESGDDVS